MRSPLGAGEDTKKGWDTWWDQVVVLVELPVAALSVTVSEEASLASRSLGALVRILEADRESMYRS